ncbi:MAG: 3',5'-cyclic-nucleotide phosphodiesterase [Acidobacteria bacterium]|nr:3',5'-cyclic-nucleotide phosphodiesterase [Acidobacteriota bacterium]
MEVQVLGTYPGENSERFILSTYVVNGEIAVDAGAIALGLHPDEQCRIHSVIVTHTHIDHIATLPLFTIENMGIRKQPPRIYATAHNVAMLKKHMFNNVFWPDLPSISSDFFQTVDVEPLETVTIGRYAFRLFPVNHPVPTYGVILRDLEKRQEVLFSSDTSICDAIWMEANRLKNLKGIFIEVSFPDSQRELALSTGHMTPGLLAGELKKLTRKVPLYITHYKTQFCEQIRAELSAADGLDFRICRVGERLSLD